MKECELGEVLLDYGLHLRQEFLIIVILLSQPVIPCITLYLLLSVALVYNSQPFSIVIYQIHSSVVTHCIFC